jgi:isopenicillin N synthase-like dioxygenase
MSLAAAKTESWAQGRIPVLDIGAYLAGGAGAAAPLARAIARTCEDTGFIVVANHGVPQHLVDDTFAVAERFFTRSEPDKLALKVGKYNIGYLPFGGQVGRHSPVNKTPSRISARASTSPATALPTTPTSSTTSRWSGSTAGPRTCPSSAPRRWRITGRWRR